MKDEDRKLLDHMYTDGPVVQWTEADLKKSDNNAKEW
jgi:hypothetical protein